MRTGVEFDFIIAGAGCAGLSLAVHLIRSGAFGDKRVLIIDKDPKKSNDRTWCFWETEEGVFEPVVFRSWKELSFHSASTPVPLNIAPYRYKMIRGIDYYTFCLDLIRKQPNFFIYHEAVSHVFSNRKATGIVVNGRAILSNYVFNSILFKRPALNKNKYWLLQHFKGWLIETEEDRFDPAKATLMDFRMDQSQGTAFCYVLPFSAKKALIEYTLFSANQLSDEAYDAGLRHYIKDVLKITHYRIEDVEKGVIPMTNARFKSKEHNLIHIGTAGGQTKGSSGYTFRFIQKQSASIVSSLEKSGKVKNSQAGIRHHFYDSVLLNILANDTLPGDAIFSRLFERNPASQVLKFLDNETSVAEELKIISTLPTLPFMKAALKQISI